MLAILAHHVCSISAMFSASLLMHMCFAALATQVCLGQGLNSSYQWVYSNNYIQKFDIGLKSEFLGCMK